MGFDYFYNRDGDRFNFYRVPQIFFEETHFKALSNDAKMLYALLFHRISLSWKHGWIDEQGRVYIIFTIEEIQEKFNCSNKTAVKIMAELDEKSGGIGLIERRRQGLGKPNIIYVKDFMSYSPTECKIYTSEVKKVHARNVESTLQEVKEVHGTNREISKRDYSKTNLREDKQNYGHFQNVRLSELDLQELKEIMTSRTENYIERLSAFIQSTGKDYKDHKATILSWYFKDQGNQRQVSAPSFEEYDKGEHL